MNLHKDKIAKILHNKKICIVGTGGCAREVFTYIFDMLNVVKLHNKKNVVFLDKDEKVSVDMQVMGCRVIKESDFDDKLYLVVLAIGDSEIRKKVFAKYRFCKFIPVIHPSAIISNYSKIGKGCIVAPNCVIGQM